MPSGINFTHQGMPLIQNYIKKWLQTLSYRQKDVPLHAIWIIMRSRILTILLLGTLALTGCGEYNAVQKYADTEYKYEYAKACYARGRYSRAYEALTGIITAMKGSGYGEESLYLMGMSAYNSGDLTAAAETFRKYYQSYPRGIYVEDANYYCGRALYDAVPDPRLDQETTKQAISELQHFLDNYPYTRLKEQTEDMIQKLQDHLVEKEYLSAKLYYDLGDYILNSLQGGSNYEACIVTSENALRDYPFAKAERREQFLLMILRSRYNLARQSINTKQTERFRQTIDDYYAFVNEFPESQYLKEAQTYLTKSQKALKGLPIEDD